MLARRGTSPTAHSPGGGCSLPEEQTIACPLDVADNAGGAGATGQPTRWILHNEASTPIILSHVNALGLEVSALDFRTHPAHADTAVFPHGPIVLPGQTAVVEGLQGQLFVAREYREVMPAEAMLAAAVDGADGHSWESFKRALPSTLSYLPEQARYRTGKGVWHVLGKPSRVLMTHRMGNIHVKNQFGALCPEATRGGPVAADDSAPPRATPPAENLNPACNVLQKAILNAVGCPVDVYFAPPSRDGSDCERFQAHLGDPAAFAAAADGRAHRLDDPASPLKFPVTYNGHAFVARMAHDGTLVARLEVDRDVVRDCPGPAREGAGAAAREAVPRGAPAALAAGTAAGGWRSRAWANVTSSPVVSEAFLREKYDILWQNRTGAMSASVPIVS